MGIKDNSRAYFVNSDNEDIKNIHLPAPEISTNPEEGLELHTRTLTR